MDGSQAPHCGPWPEYTCCTMRRMTGSGKQHRSNATTGECSERAGSDGCVGAVHRASPGATESAKLGVALTGESGCGFTGSDRAPRQEQFRQIFLGGAYAIQKVCSDFFPRKRRLNWAPRTRRTHFYFSRKLRLKTFLQNFFLHF